MRLVRTIHDMTVRDRWYHQLARGTKTHEVRRLTRDYQRGDVLYVRNEDNASVPPLTFEVTHVLTSAHFEGVAPGFAVLSLRRIL